MLPVNTKKNIPSIVMANVHFCPLWFTAVQSRIYWRIVNSQHVLIVFAETPGANYALSQFFHQDDDGDDHPYDHDHCDNHDDDEVDYDDNKR